MPCTHSWAAAAVRRDFDTRTKSILTRNTHHQVQTVAVANGKNDSDYSVDMLPSRSIYRQNAWCLLAQSHGCVRLLWCATTMLPVRAGVAAVVVDCESVAWRWKSVSQHARTHARTIHTERERTIERQFSCWIKTNGVVLFFFFCYNHYPIALALCYQILSCSRSLLAFPLFLAPASKNTRKDDNVIMRCCSFCYAPQPAAASSTRVRHGFLTRSPVRAICHYRCGCARLCVCVCAFVLVFLQYDDTLNTVYTRIWWQKARIQSWQRITCTLQTDFAVYLLIWRCSRCTVGD